jgi:hypothetical protein
MWPYPGVHGLPLPAFSGRFVRYASCPVCELDWQWITLWKCLWIVLWISSGDNATIAVLQAEPNALALHLHHCDHTTLTAL